MFGLDVVIESLLGYLGRKASRVAGRADAEVDLAIDGAMERLRRLVAKGVGENRLEVAVRQASSGTDGDVSPAVRDELEAVLAGVLCEHPGWAAELEAAARDVTAALDAAGSRGGAVILNRGDVRADGGGVAALHMGDVTFTNPRLPGAHRA